MIKITIIIKIVKNIDLEDKYLILLFDNFK